MKPAKASRSHDGKRKPTARRRSVSSPPKLDPGRLLHDLEVHQVELQTQNEELRRVRRDLETTLARYTELFDFAPIGYATLDELDIVRDLNLVGARLLRAHHARAAGARFGAMIVREDVAAFNAVAAQVRATHQPHVCELRIDGERPAAVLRVTVCPQPREHEGLLLAFEDVTVRNVERDRLASTERALRVANERKDEFLAMLSHELRNPLAPIRSSLFVLAAAPPGSAEASSAREIVERQVAHMTRLVDDLLDVTRISRGKVRLQREHVDLVDLVHRTVDDQRSAFEARGVALGVALPPDELWVDVDPARIVQAVSNVLGNALKFTPAEGSVAVMLRRRDGIAELRVRDSGEGIAPDLLPHVLEPFVQAPQGLDRSSGGLGLGLAMVRAFIELHDGSVRVTSAGVGQGTEITVTLPLSSPRVAPVARPTVAAQSRRVLVIEDQPDAARALETALTMVGFQVRVANDGHFGLVVAHEFHPEVVLCDIGLPDMTGYDVARAFRDDRELKDTYLVALSGYAQPEDIERATAAGFSKHLAKPASLDTLTRVISEAPLAAAP